MKSPIRVAVTGAAGQISYSLLFRIASGDMLGQDQPIILQLLEIESAMNNLKGVVMELEDCAFPLVHNIITTYDPYIAFKDADIAILKSFNSSSFNDLNKFLNNFSNLC